MPRFNPPAPAASGGILRLTIQVTVQGQIYEMILDYMATTAGAISIGTMTAFVAVWRAACEPALRACLPAGASITAYIVAEVNQGVNPSQTVTTGLPLAGLVVGSFLPGTVAVVISKTSTLKGQHGRGRFFPMAVPLGFQNVADPNTITAAAVAIYNSFANAVVNVFTVGALFFNMCISTRPIAPQTLVTNAVPVANFIVQPLLGTSRHRKEGRGI